MAHAAEFEKSIEKSTVTRLNNLFQLIDKCLNRINSKKFSGDDLQQIRYATAKILSTVAVQEKVHKDAVIKHASNLEILLNVIQQVSEDQIIHNAVGILNELLGKFQTGKRALILVNHGVTSVLFGLLKQASYHDIVLSNDNQLLIHCVLSKTGPKDRKFAVKARLNHALLFTLNLIKNNSVNVRYTQSLLHVLKLYTANSVNASYLGKHNAIGIMFRVISNCGRRHIISTKLALENLNNLTKSKSNSARLVGMGGVPLLLTQHTEWHHADSKNRFISLRKAILNTLKNITNLKSGRRAFTDADGIRVLYDTALELSDCREVESLIMLVSLIMRKCFPRNQLPLKNVLCSVSHALPRSDMHIPDCYNLPEFQATRLFENTQGGEESEHSSLDDDDDDIDSDDERFNADLPEEVEDDQGDSLELADMRTMEELRMYDKFFPEVFEFDLHLPPLDPEALTESPTQNERPFSRESGNKGSQQFGRYLDRSGRVDSYSSLSGDHSGVKLGTSENGLITAANLKSTFSTVSQEVLLSGSSSHFKSSFKSNQKLNAARKVKPSSRKSFQMSDKKLRKASSAKTINELSDVLCITSLLSPHEFQDANSGATSIFEDYLEDYRKVVHDPYTYTQMANDTFSVYRFHKLAYPDLHGATGIQEPEMLCMRKFTVQRHKVFEDIDRMIHPDSILDQVVYDLDAIIDNAGTTYCQEYSNLSNQDELRLGKQEGSDGALKFTAEFECGNLRKVIRIRDCEYDLILNPDINTNHYHQWFYFEVSNMESDKDYRFNIINCEKLNSQFNFGMQPVMFSVMEAVQGRGAWVRAGTDICYYRNHFLRSSLTTGGVKGKSYYTSSFTIRFKHAFDVCYIAYHYPYTYTMLKTHLSQLESQLDQNQIFFRNQTLCKTLGGNSVPVLTITSQPRSYQRENREELVSRPYIFLSGRVHPGESNASWVMKGTVDFLLSSHPVAQQLRDMYIFKIVPMLNPDGVINGNHRCSLVAEDLNRRWLKPCPILHPSIYHTKGLLQYLSAVNKTPQVYCDYHGHSRRKNIFMYGCSPLLSWIPNDTHNPTSPINKAINSDFKTLPRLLQLSCPSFCLQNCSFVVEKTKESTARVVVWRQIGVVRSYTMESSYCGFDQGKYKDQHINTFILEEMGHKFCEALVPLAKTGSGFDQQLPDFGGSTVDFTILDGMDEPRSNLRPKHGRGTAYGDSGNTSESEDEQSMDDEENYREDESSL